MAFLWTGGLLHLDGGSPRLPRPRGRTWASPSDRQAPPELPPAGRVGRRGHGATWAFHLQDCFRLSRIVSGSPRTFRPDGGRPKGTPPMGQHQSPRRGRTRCGARPPRSAVEPAGPARPVHGDDRQRRRAPHRPPAAPPCRRLAPSRCAVHRWMAGGGGGGAPVNDASSRPSSSAQDAGGSLAIQGVGWGWAYPPAARRGISVRSWCARPANLKRRCSSCSGSSHSRPASPSPTPGSSEGAGHRRGAEANAALGDTVSALERSTAIHDRLTLARGGEGNRGIAEAVHELTDLPVEIEDRYGNLLARAGQDRDDTHRKPPNMLAPGALAPRSSRSATTTGSSPSPPPAPTCSGCWRSSTLTAGGAQDRRL